MKLRINLGVLSTYQKSPLLPINLVIQRWFSTIFSQLESQCKISFSLNNDLELGWGVGGLIPTSYFVLALVRQKNQNQGCLQYCTVFVGFMQYLWMGSKQLFKQFLQTCPYLFLDGPHLLVKCNYYLIIFVCFVISFKSVLQFIIPSKMYFIFFCQQLYMK